MSSPRVVLSDAAANDILEQADWYIQQSGAALAQRWERAVTTSITRLSKLPDSGTLCHFKSKQLRNLRRISVQRFSKHLIFYRYEDSEIYILRVIHGARDLETQL